MSCRVCLSWRLSSCPLVAGVPASGVVLLWWCVPRSIVAYFLPEQGKTWQKLDFICSLWCFLGNFGDNKRQNLNLFLKCGCWCVVVCSSRGGVSWCPLVAGVPALGLVRSSGGVFPPFCPLSRFVLVVSLANMALFRVFRGFLEGFMGFVWVCVALVLCVACVAFCARVELGGYMTCCVFASVFILLLLLFVLLSLCLFSFCLSSACLVYSCCLVCLLGLWLLFLFPFGVMGILFGW